MGTLLAVRWLWMHRAEMPGWGSAAAQAARESWRVHVVDPLLSVKDELTRTFHDKPGTVSVEEFQVKLRHQIPESHG